MNNIIFTQALNIGGSCHCGWAAKFGFNFLQTAQNYELDPKSVASMSLARIIDRLENMNDPEVPNISEERLCSNNRWHRSSAGFRESLRYALKRSKEFKGLCLDC